MTHHIYLVPGFFGFANLGELRYFAHVREYLSEVCGRLGLDAEVHAVKTHPTSSLRLRATCLLDAIAATLPGERCAVHLIGHSSGGLDARLVASPGVSLGSRVDPEPVAARLTTIVTVASPHHGTPVAGFFTSLLGQRLLQVLSLSTIYLLRFGQMPLGVLLKTGAAFARLDNLGVNSALLDQLFGQLLADFSPRRRGAIGRLLADVRDDQALMPQLSPEGMDVFNALARDRPGLRYGCVVTRARAPGVGSTLAAGFDPTAHASHAVYGALHRLARGDQRKPPPPVGRTVARALVRAYGTLPDARANDGVVPTLSQVHGDLVHVAAADHLDVVGHFHDPRHTPPHFDWLVSGTGFDRPRFEALWTDVAWFLAGRALRPGGSAGPSLSGSRRRRPRSR